MSQLEQMDNNNSTVIMIIKKRRKWLEIFHIVTFSFGEGMLSLQPAGRQRMGFVSFTNNRLVAVNTGCNMQLQKAFSQVGITSSWYRTLSVTSVS